MLQILNLYRNTIVEGDFIDIKSLVEDAVLDGISLEDADLKDVDLRGAKLKGAILEDADLEGADLTGANLTSAVLSGADFCGAKLDEAILDEADIENANFRNASLKGAFMRNIDPADNADFTNANLEEAYLNNSDFTNIYFDDAILDNIHVDKTKLLLEDIVKAENPEKISTTGNCIIINPEESDMIKYAESILNTRLVEISGFGHGHDYEEDIDGNEGTVVYSGNNISPNSFIVIEPIYLKYPSEEILLGYSLNMKNLLVMGVCVKIR